MLIHSDQLQLLMIIIAKPIIAIMINSELCNLYSMSTQILDGKYELQKVILGEGSFSKYAIY